MNWAACCVLIPVLLWGEEGFSAKVDLSTHTLPLDKRLEVTLNLQYPPNYNVDEVALRKSLLGNQPVDPFWLIDEKKDQKSFTYTLEPILTGKHPLSFTVDFQDPAKKPVQIITEPVVVHVESVPADPAFRLVALPLIRLDEPNPIDISEENRQKILWRKPSTSDLQRFQEHTFPALRVLLSLLALVALFLYLTMRKKGEIAPRPKASIKILTLNSIRQLEQHLPKEESAALPFYQELSVTLRRYIQERFGIKAPHLTTEEFITQAAISQQLDPQAQASLKGFLEHMDLAKFAHQIPPLSEAKESLDKAKSFIEKT